MNLHTTGIIIEREYLNRVKKKSFLIVTFVVPVLFAAVCILPSIIMLKAKEEAKVIAVVDRSGIVADVLEDTQTIHYADCSGMNQDSIKVAMKELGFDAVLCISELDEAGKTVTADVYSVKPLGVEMTENIDNRIDKAVEDYRISSYGIEGLKDIMQDVKSDVKLHSYTIDEQGKETVSEAGVYMFVSMFLGVIIYMFIVLFGGMVMSSVIEEKSSRVVEVLVSSVKATELMFGKIVGIALVALTQFLLWVILTLAIIGVAGSVLGTDLLSAGVSDPTELVQAAGAEMPEMAVVLSTLSNLPFIEILVSFLLFFVFGYILYSTVFAAIGSAVENEGDTQQLQLPVTIPLLVGFFISMYAFKAPDSAIVFWGSMIPFSSPIVMLARLPFDPPMLEIVVSVVILVLTSIIFAWASAKIYKVGILMYGKKSTWKDLWKWLKQK